jgi:osmotically-inducible protein OsmY
MKKMLWLGWLALVLVGGWGCDTLQTRPEDERLSQAVMERLNQDSMVRRLMLSVVVADGVVTLRGNITDESVRLRAKSIAETTPGVTKVMDQTTRL